MEININELIADAKAIKETAVINAKKQLEEAFIPRLNSIISARIQNEAEDDEDQNAEISDTELEVPAADPTAEPSLDEPVPAQPEAPVADPTAVATPEPALDPAITSTEPTAEPTAEPAAPVVDPTAVEPVADPTSAPEPVTGNEPELEKDEDDIELESLMKELESEDDDFNKVDDEDAYNGDPNYVPSEDGSLDDDDLDEEIDLDEVLANFSLDEGEECDDCDDEKEEEKEEAVNEQLNAVMAENEQLKAELAKLRGENTVLESKLTEVGTTLSEVNLLNAKLLYTSKLFKNYNLNNTQKRKVVENFDRAKNIREVKLVYTTVAESFKHTELKNKTNVNKITEGIASKTIASTQPAKQTTSAPVEDSTKPAIISENTLVDVAGAQRLKKLAGIIKD